ncbi:MAG: DUF1501 domain-containing protein [Rhodospirillaceae bacterium]|nr:MAG: DUF1501 domain-containing protein [Rhodospirillaceae bacterium]
MDLSRRLLLSSSGALLALGGGLRVAFAADTIPGGTSATTSTPQSTNPILIVLFCRFGQDGMQLVAPAEDTNYIQNRPTIRVQPSGNNAGLPIGSLGGVNMYFHPNMPELKAIYDAKQLAVIPAVGVPTALRSHFEVQDMMERGGSDGKPLASTGWLARHMASGGASTTGVLSTIAVSTNAPTSYLGDSLALALSNPQNFNIYGGTNITNVTANLVKGTTAYESKAQETLKAIADVQAALHSTATTTANNLGYTNGDLSTPLKSLAQLIKANVGVSVATVDMGGWDHHQNLVPAFNGRATELSKSIGAFWQDVANFQNQITLVTMTEFGRRFQENSNRGLDHGSASTMMVLGGGVNGGTIYGQWPGLASYQLYNDDLAVTTDYREVLGEILVKRHGETALSNVFPDVFYRPLGLFS